MDAGTLKNITNFLGGGWLSIALAALLIGFLIWWKIKGHNIKVDQATKETLKEREEVEQGQREEGKESDAHDAAGRDETDSFLGNDNAPK